MSEIYDLKTLTGLTDEQFAQILVQNPRAYMAVKGAVAEKHLEIYLEKLIVSGKIKSIKKANSDFDKDFYITTNQGKEISLECKNTQVLTISPKKQLIIDYFLFLVRNKYLSVKTITKQDPDKIANHFEEYLGRLSSAEIKAVYSGLPQEFKESSIPRYRFSQAMIPKNSLTDVDVKIFLKQFDPFPLTIDFQRTRNSTDDTGDTRAQRMYKIDEIDIVAACIFSRTMKWEFVFGHKTSFEIHKKYSDRFSNKLVINPDTWTDNIIEIIRLF